MREREGRAGFMDHPVGAGRERCKREDIDHMTRLEFRGTRIIQAVDLWRYATWTTAIRGPTHPRSGAHGAVEYRRTPQYD